MKACVMYIKISNTSSEEEDIYKDILKKKKNLI